MSSSQPITLDTDQIYMNGDDVETSKATVTVDLDDVGKLGILNTGTLASSSKRGIDTSGTAASDALLGIVNLGTISGSDDGIRIDSDLPDGVLALINDGTITSTTDGQAIDFNSVATNKATLIANLSDGVITSTDADAVRPGNNAIVANLGVIYAGGENGASKNDGIDFQDYSGTVLNDGAISGARHAITSSADLTVVNGPDGHILGRDGSGVGSDGNGSVLNFGTITGAYDGSGTGDGDGVDIDGSASVVNYGVIQGTGAAGNGSDGYPNTSEGVSIGGGVIVNEKGAVISGANNAILVDDSSQGDAPYATTVVNYGVIAGLDGYGIHITDTFGDTITNAGTIAGTTAAIALGDGDDTLNILTGSVISGTVDGGGGTNTVNLIGEGTFEGADNFQRMSVTGSWTLSGDQSYDLIGLNTGAVLTLEGGLDDSSTVAFTSSGTLVLEEPASFSAAVVNFDASDYIDFAALAYDPDATVAVSGSDVTVTSGSLSYTLTVTLAADVSGFVLSEDCDGSLLLSAVVCFLPGSLIATENGDVAVENLRPGMNVPTFDGVPGELKDIVWVGRQDVRVAQGIAPDLAGCPVRVRAGALADGAPSVDLLVTPEHCLFFSGKFVPARMLVNGASIAYDRNIRSYTCYHIETRDHAVIRANGILTESYLDTGNRRHFRPLGQDGVIAAFNGAVRDWEKDAAAELCVAREVVEPLYCQIAGRAVAMGFVATPSAPVTHDPDLYLLTSDGRKLLPTHLSEGRFAFHLPSGLTHVCIVSRTARPCDAIGPFVDDRRDLGVLIGQITLDDAHDVRVLKNHLTQDIEGWDVREAVPMRWTQGRAMLLLPRLRPDSSAMLTLHVHAAGPYCVDALLNEERHSNAA